MRIWRLTDLGDGAKTAPVWHSRTECCLFSFLVARLVEEFNYPRRKANKLPSQVLHLARGDLDNCEKLPLADPRALLANLSISSLLVSSLGRRVAFGQSITAVSGSQTERERRER